MRDRWQLAVTGALVLGTALAGVDVFTPTGANAVVGIGVLLGVLGCLAAIARTRPEQPALAAALVSARWLGYDSYYAPYARRASDGGLLSAWWIGLLVAASLAAAAAIWRRRDLWALAAPALLLDAFTALAADAGH